MWQLAAAFVLVLGLDQQTSNHGRQLSADTKVDWVWTRDVPACSLRQVIDGEGRVLIVSRTPGADETTLSLEYEPVAPPPDGPADHLRNGTVTFEPTGQAGADLWTSLDGRGRRYVTAHSHHPNLMDNFSAASAVSLSHQKIGAVRVPLRSSRAAAYALRQCEDARMREWGIDPVAWRALKVRPVPVKSLTEWLSSDDYPIAALLNGSQGYMILRFEVGPNGRILKCQRINRGIPDHSRNRICDKLEHRARFKPGLSAAGEAVTAPYALIIRFALSN